MGYLPIATAFPAPDARRSHLSTLGFCWKNVPPFSNLKHFQGHRRGAAFSALRHIIIALNRGKLNFLDWGGERGRGGVDG